MQVLAFLPQNSVGYLDTDGFRQDRYRGISGCSFGAPKPCKYERESHTVTLTNWMSRRFGSRQDAWRQLAWYMNLPNHAAPLTLSTYLIFKLCIYNKLGQPNNAYWLFHQNGYASRMLFLHKNECYRFQSQEIISQQARYNETQSVDRSVLNPIHCDVNKITRP